MARAGAADVSTVKIPRIVRFFFMKGNMGARPENSNGRVNAPFSA
jgi:hypothetical protein